MVVITFLLIDKILENKTEYNYEYLANLFNISLQYLETPSSKEDFTAFTNNIRGYSYHGDDSTEELKPLIDEGTKIDDENSRDNNIHLITKLVERASIFLNDKKITLGLSNNGQEFIVKSLFSIITKNINFLKYDFEKDS